jgi:hypothetical protein
MSDIIEIKVTDQLDAAVTTWQLGSHYSQRHRLGWAGWVAFKLGLLLSQPKLSITLQYLEMGGHLGLTYTGEPPRRGQWN